MNPTTRASACVLALALPSALFLWVCLASAPRASTTAARELGAVLPAPDLALGSSARHLRMPSLEEPWAGFHDTPGALDLDPAGAWFDPRSRSTAP